MPSLGAAATAGLRAKLKALWDHWTQGWFPTAVRNGYLRNIDGRSALATAVIVPGGLRQVGDFWHERVEHAGCVTSICLDDRADTGPPLHLSLPPRPPTTSFRSNDL